MKKVAILQSNYIPWKGYFDLIAAVDEFVLFDEMQYTRRDWRNRNKIKTSTGSKWISVPVKTKGLYYQKISDTVISGTEWASQHWNKIRENYSSAPYFSEISTWLRPLYLDETYTHLSVLNYRLIVEICAYLEISTRISSSKEYDLVDGKTERVAGICAQAGAKAYVSGPAAQDYIDETILNKNGISVTWFEYSGYPAYPQLWGEFDHYVSIIDLLFCCGPRSRQYMRYV
jgi:hypothetical protein